MSTSVDATAADTWFGADDDTREHPELVLVHHRDLARCGSVLRLFPGDDLQLGRGTELSGFGVLDDGRLSRAHARLTYRDGLLELTDLKSRNGTWVDGASVTSTRLLPGAVVGLGDLLFVVRWAPGRRPAPIDAPGWTGESVALGRTLAALRDVAPLDSPVLILGETGTGKELAARELHRASGVPGPFIAVNCGAMPDALLHSELFGHTRGAFSGADRPRTGLIEGAGGGSIFLDEVGEASEQLQAALLRVIQERELRPVGGNRSVRVTARFIAATHRDLPTWVSSGRFREDLFARLARWTVTLPPLRERREDILDLARGVAERVAGFPVRFHPKVAERFLLHHWPQNIRELQGVVERVVVRAGRPVVVGPDPAINPDLPGAGRRPRAETAPSGGSAKTRLSPDDLRRLLAANDGNMKACAEAAGVGRNTFYRWVRQAGIDPASFR